MAGFEPLLLPNQLSPVAGHSSTSPSMELTWGNNGSTSPGVAWRLCTLAPRSHFGSHVYGPRSAAAG
jgi:hypothetical protein